VNTVAPCVGELLTGLVARSLNQAAMVEDAAMIELAIELVIELMIFITS